MVSSTFSGDLKAHLKLMVMSLGSTVHGAVKLEENNMNDFEDLDFLTPKVITFVQKNWNFERQQQEYP